MTDEQKKKATERAKKLESKKLARRLAMRIHEMKKVCGLSDRQVRRLQLAAKGAIKNELNGFEKRLERVRQLMVGGFVEADVIVEEVKEQPKPKNGDGPKSKSQYQDKEVAAFVEEVGRMYNPFDMMMVGQSISPVEQQEFWKTQIEKTLKPDQREKYTRFLNARKQLKRRATVMKIVVGLDAKLLLTTDQRQKMETLIDAQLGKFFEHLPIIEGVDALENFEHFQSTQQAVARMRREAKGFLSNEQSDEFAVPTSDAWTQFDFLLQEEFVAVEAGFAVPEGAGFLGVQMAIDAAGVVITNVSEDQPASKAGLKAGDIITKFNDVEVGTVNELLEAVAETEPQDKVTITFIRDEKSSEVEVTMGTRP